MKPPVRRAPRSRKVEVALALGLLAIGLAWYFLRSAPPPPPAPAAPVVAEIPPPADETVAAPEPRQTVLLVNLNSVFSGSKRTAAEQAKVMQMRNDAEATRQNLSGDALAAFVQSTQTALTNEFGTYRANELSRIISAIQVYRQAGGFKTVYDSGSNQGQSFGLELLPPGVTGYDGTADILAALDQSDGQ
jgi:hypothetical protein